MKKEKPILFSTPMVQALINGTKTMTRRVMKKQPLIDQQTGDWLTVGFGNKHEVYPWEEFVKVHKNWTMCPYGQVGDILLIRETFAPFKAVLTQPPSFYYKASSNVDIKWKPAIHMPKIATRIWLEIVEIGVERLQDISVADICDEGVRYPINNGNPIFKIGEDDSAWSFLADKTEFTESELLFAHWAELWCKINGRASWDANPWVWVVKFKKIQK